jgi:hypothetical protein
MAAASLMAITLSFQISLLNSSVMKMTLRVRITTEKHQDESARQLPFSMETFCIAIMGFDFISFIQIILTEFQYLVC